MGISKLSPPCLRSRSGCRRTFRVGSGCHPPRPPTSSSVHPLLTGFLVPIDEGSSKTSLDELASPATTPTSATQSSTWVHAARPWLMQCGRVADAVRHSRSCVFTGVVAIDCHKRSRSTAATTPREVRKRIFRRACSAKSLFENVLMWSQPWDAGLIQITYGGEQ